MARLSRRVRGALCFLLCWVLVTGSVWMALGLAWPEASGDDTKKKSGTTLDCSNAGDGYVMVKQKAGKKKKLKARLSQGDVTYTYDLNTQGDYEVYPLQMGNGKYSLNVYEQVKGTKYAQVSSISFKVSGMDENAPFLCPNQYVWYTASSPVVAKAEEICKGLNDEGKVKAVCSFMEKNFSYDFIGALTATSNTGYLPDVDEVFERHMGICFDLSAVVACMLRSQGIPTKLVIGYAGSNYHAWTNIMVNGKYMLYDPTARLGGITVKKDEYTVERFY